MRRTLLFAAALVFIVAGCGHRSSPRPVAFKEWRAVVDDWLANARFTERHSCGDVVVARTRVVPRYHEGMPLVHALDVYERSACSGSGSAAGIKMGMSDAAVADTAGAPVPWRSGPKCWWYRKPADGRAVCFSSAGYVDRILIAVHG